MRLIRSAFQGHMHVSEICKPLKLLTSALYDLHMRARSNTARDNLHLLAVISYVFFYVATIITFLPDQEFADNIALSHKQELTSGMLKRLKDDKTIDSLRSEFEKLPENSTEPVEQFADPVKCRLKITGLGESETVDLQWAANYTKLVPVNIEPPQHDMYLATVFGMQYRYKIEYGNEFEYSTQSMTTTFLIYSPQLTSKISKNVSLSYLFYFLSLATAYGHIWFNPKAGTGGLATYAILGDMARFSTIAMFVHIGFFLFGDFQIRGDIFLIPSWILIYLLVVVIDESNLFGTVKQWLVSLTHVSGTMTSWTPVRQNADANEQPTEEHEL